MFLYFNLFLRHFLNVNKILFHLFLKNDNILCGYSIINLVMFLFYQQTKSFWFIFYFFLKRFFHLKKGTNLVFFVVAWLQALLLLILPWKIEIKIQLKWSFWIFGQILRCCWSEFMEIFTFIELHCRIGYIFDSIQ